MAVQISGNDITVPRDGTFSRNVSIAGTLTYEDVTNVDSIGLVTARNGIEVGASPGVAASISVDGNAIFSGITTIGGNVKVGSGITLSPDGDAFHTGVVTATSFVGDGSGLTGAGPTLANGADNRVVTATGANALNAETGVVITSDSELIVGMTDGGGASPDARLQVRGDTFAKAQIQVLSTHNDDNPASLQISKSRSSGNTILGDNDDIGQINFGGNDGNGYHNVGRIMVSSSGEGNGNDDLPTVMKFFTTANGSASLTEQMKISSAGHITMPNRPMFSGRPNISNAFRSATETMQLTSRVNVGSHWSNSNYNFTCPVTGYYFMQCNFISNVETYLFFRKDTGSGFAKIYTSSHGYGIGGGSYRSIAGNHIEYCAVGDKLDFYVQGGYYGLEHGSGTIFLLA